MDNDVEKWNRYYSNHKQPPWESPFPYHGLVSFLEDIHIRKAVGIGEFIGGGVGGSFTSSVFGDSNTVVQNVIKTPQEREIGDDNARKAFRKGAYVCELGAGCSASTLYLAELGFQTTAVDISPLAKERFFNLYQDEVAVSRVNYIIADILDLDGSQTLHNQLLQTLPQHGYVNDYE